LAATVRIDSAEKEKLRFLASVLLEQGIRITLQEALGLMVDYALENEEEFLKKLKELPPFEEDPAWKALENSRH